jgi:hypothetical protein
MPLQNDSEFAFEFNLASCAFVTYAFFDPRARLEQQFADRATRDPAFVERAVAELRAQVKISLHVDDLPQLARYNQIRRAVAIQLRAEGGVRAPRRRYDQRDCEAARATLGDKGVATNLRTPPPLGR